ncbi:hypothetical protein GALL_266280 [mine drainage metagenome]|uniref:HNH nuclease domain-containing protein n=1 Tax=mine drainage metagenome TaxID=410659 RepID=A0A1J5RPR8_9ZZZZ
MEDSLHYSQLLRGFGSINRTEIALVGRGVDSGTAARLRKDGWTLGKLSQESDERLVELGLSNEVIGNLRAGARPEIPFENLIQVLLASRFACCVCHDSSKAIIVHHIKAWAESRNHHPENLAALCADDHVKAHSVSQLTRNLDERTLSEFKRNWESEVRRTNTEAVLEASRLDADAWWYFNHVRLFELAADLGLRLTALDNYPYALSTGLVQKDGLLKPRSDKLHYMYSGGDGMLLYAYVREVMNTVLSKLTIFNISDSLDKSRLAPTVKSGDVIYTQGAHNFSAQTRADAGRDQTRSGIRKANHVSVNFTFDGWEATSNSAWSCWLSGRHDAGSLVKVVDVSKVDGVLRITGTVLGICCALEGLKCREYAATLLRSGAHLKVDEDSIDEGTEW